MINRLLGLLIAVTVFTGKAWADKPTVTFIVPYKVVCEKQTDGTKQIRVKVALRKAAHAFVLNGTTGTLNTDDNADCNDTTLLQATDPCRNLSGELAITGKLYGFDAALIGDEVIASYFVDGGEAATSVDLCAFFLNVNLCCGKTLESALDGKVYLDKDETITWVDLGNFSIFTNFTSVKNLMLSNPPYDTDTLLREEHLNPGNITILNALYNLAVKNLHGQPCCFENFGLGDEDAQRVLCTLLDKINTCPTDFTAKGSWGSCGDTSTVNVTGTITKPIIIDVCGKKLCFTDLPSVRSSSEDSEYAITLGSSAAQCFGEFFVKYLSTLLSGQSGGASFTPPLLSCGIPGELNLLIAGTRKFTFGNINESVKLKLMCVDPLNHIYAFAFTQSRTPEDSEKLIILGCRFKLEECKKCCK